jgi:signal transduction histidine kinase
MSQNSGSATGGAFFAHARSAPRWRGARLRLGAAFFALALALFAAVGLLSGQASRQQSEAESGAALAQLAGRLTLALDMGLFERKREIDNLAALESLIGEDIEPARWRALLERRQSNLPHYTWIGVADARGRVLAATGGLLEGVDVSARPWFGQGLQRPWIGDVHDALLLERLLPRQRNGEPLRLLDFSAPWVREQRVVGVVGAHLSLQWAEERRQVALGARERARQVELLVVSRDGRILLGPREPALPSAGLMQAAVEGAPGTPAPPPQMLTWGDGRRYLTAPVRGAAESGSAGLGWVLVARQPEAAALAAATALQHRIWALGALGAALFGVAGWWLAGRLTAPLAQLARQAQQLMPAVRSGAPPLHDEIEQLASSLGTLLAELRLREQALAAANTSLEARVLERTQALQQANADLQSFSRSVSHDLKGPIGSIGMVLRLLLEQQGSRLEPGAQRNLGALVQECDRLRVLIDELLTLAMVEQQVLRARPVAMQAAVEQVLEALRAAPEGDAARRAQVHVGPLPVLPADAVLVRQVWHNLIANAVKFSAKVPAPRIEVSARLDAGEWLFSVADNGAGFDMAQSQRLFGVFQRLHRASDFTGTGVGLSIVKRVVHRHGGRVGAEGEPGRGARFWFTLPADQK